MGWGTQKETYCYKYVVFVVYAQDESMNTKASVKINDGLRWRERAIESESESE